MREAKTYYSDLFKKIANEQKVLLNKETGKHGTTYVQSLVILYLLHIKEQFGPEHEISQKDIEQYLSLKSPTVTHILCRMEENQLIIREKSKKDSRVKHLSVTEKGIEQVPAFFEVLDNLQNKMTKGMCEEEKSQLKTLLTKVLSNLEEGEN